MQINQIRVSNLLSFGPDQVFDRFSRFNLFIGKNGSGKSNILRLIGELPTELDAIQGSITVKTLNEIREIQTYHARGEHDKFTISISA
jgi:predicted ATPase